MLICHCQAVNDRVIRRAIADGAASVEEVARACGAGSRCGGCWPALEALLDGEGTTEQQRGVRSAA